MIKFLNELPDLRAQVSNWKLNGYRIGLVPTMGGLHDGHLSLLKIAREHCDKVVTTIYVNPKQFSDSEDFVTYPRNLDADLEKLAASNICDLIYKPNQMYHTNHATQINLNGAGLSLETESRPHFFSGVSVIVLKLFNQIQPSIAVFGEKDFQQLLVIKQLTRDLDLPVQVIGAQTCRERDGLAMSSRNNYLSKSERKVASNIYRILKITKERIQSGINVDVAIQNGIAELNSVGIYKIDYFSLRDQESFENLTRLNKNSRLLVALHVGSTRLIDNIAVPDV